MPSLTAASAMASSATAPFWSVVIYDNGIESAGRRLDRCGVQLDAGDVAPELLEPVVVARVRGERVEDHVEVVRDDPAALGLAGDRGRQRPVLVLQALTHLVPNRLRLARVLPGREHEEVRVAAHGPHVEDDDVLRQLLLGKAGDSAGVFEWCQWLFESSGSRF